MVFFNYGTMQMAAKVVYYGPGLCGKTTNLQYIYSHTSNDSRGEMVSLETETDRTLFFDLLPIDIGTIGGFATRIQLYTVPGQVFYNTTRKLVLKGVDGVVFVADSQRPMLQANIDSLNNLEENLAEIGLSLEEVPLVLQYNKRDLPNILSVDELNAALNRGNWPYFESSALTGQGVFESLKGISKLTLMSLKRKLAKDQDDVPAETPALPAQQAQAAPVRSSPEQSAQQQSAPEQSAPEQVPSVGSGAPAAPVTEGTQAGSGAPSESGGLPEGTDSGQPVRRSARDSVPPPEPIRAPELSPSDTTPRSGAAQDPASGELTSSSPVDEQASEDEPFPALASEPDGQDEGPSVEPDDSIFAQEEGGPAEAAGAMGSPFLPDDRGAEEEIDPFAPPAQEAQAPEPVRPEPEPASEAAAPASTGPAATGPAPTGPAPTPAALTQAEPTQAAPTQVAPTQVAPTQAAPIPAAKRRRRSIDALGELEKLRKQVKTPRGSRSNGHGELSREIQMTVAREDFARLRRLRLSVQVEDEQQQVVEAVHDLDVEISGQESLDRVLLRLNVALRARD